MKLNQEVVKFRDGTELTVTEANWAVSIKLQELEEQANKNPPEDAKLRAFSLALYPKLLACSSGIVPSMEEALEMPSTELDKWYFAVKRINPDWFTALDEAEAKEAALEKKEKTPIKSTKG